MERFRRGDDSAFDRIVERHSAEVAALANRLLGWPGDVDDVVQEVFLSAFLGLQEVPGRVPSADVALYHHGEQVPQLPVPSTAVPATVRIGDPETVADLRSEAATEPRWTRRPSPGSAGRCRPCREVPGSHRSEVPAGAREPGDLRTARDHGQRDAGPPEPGQEKTERAIGRFVRGEIVNEEKIKTLLQRADELAGEPVFGRVTRRRDSPADSPAADHQDGGAPGSRQQRRPCHRTADHPSCEWRDLNPSRSESPRWKSRSGSCRPRRRRRCKLVQEVLEKDRQQRRLAALEAELASIPDPVQTGRAAGG